MQLHDETITYNYHGLLVPAAEKWVPAAERRGPRIYFEGNNVDNDALEELLHLLRTTSVETGMRDQDWGVVVISKSGGTLETAAAYRVFRREAVDHYGRQSPRLRELI